MSSLEKYKTLKAEILKAKRWQKHLSATGRLNDSCCIHSIGADPEVCIQYDAGGQNYWKASNEAGKTFVTAFNRIIEHRLRELVQASIDKMESDLVGLTESAKSEYLQLFGEAIDEPATQAEAGQ